MTPLTDEFVEHRGHRIYVGFDDEEMQFYAEVVSGSTLGKVTETTPTDTAEEAVELAKQLVDDILEGVR